MLSAVNGVASREYGSGPDGPWQREAPLPQLTPLQSPDLPPDPRLGSFSAFNSRSAGPWSKTRGCGVSATLGRLSEPAVPQRPGLSAPSRSVAPGRGRAGGEVKERLVFTEPGVGIISRSGSALNRLLINPFHLDCMNWSELGTFQLRFNRDKNGNIGLRGNEIRSVGCNLFIPRVLRCPS